MSYAYIVTGSRLKHRTLICCDKVNNKSNHVLNIQYNKKLSWGSLILLLRATVLNLSQWRNLYFHLVKIMNSLTKKKKKWTSAQKSIFKCNFRSPLIEFSAPEKTHSTLLWISFHHWASIQWKGSRKHLYITVWLG